MLVAFYNITHHKRVDGDHGTGTLRRYIMGMV